MEITNRKRGLFITVFIMSLVFLMAVFIYALSPVFDKDYTGQMDDLSTAWYIGYEPSGDPVRFATLAQGEVFTMTAQPHYLPESENAATLLIVTDSCMVQVFCYDTLLYTACKKEYDNGVLVPNMVHMVNIPLDYQGQPLTVQLTAGRNGAKIDTRGFCFGDIESVARSFTQRKGYAILFGCFFVAFGSILIILQILLHDRLHLLSDYIFQGCLLIDLGLFVMNYNHVSHYLIRDDTFNSYLLYITLILIPYLIYSVMVANQKILRSKLNNFFLIADITIAVTVSILNSTGVIFINQLTGIICLFVGIHLLITLIHMIVVNARMKKDVKMFSYVDLANQSVRFGLFILIIFCLIELLLWRIGFSRRIIPGTDVRGCSMIAGTLIMTACIIVGYFYHCVAIQKSEAISAQLKGLAYTDKLTGLSNRAYCVRVLSELDEDKSPCIIISLDLDGLKAINDIEGHQRGDLYITGFSEVLGEIFKEELLVGRMGGDEFVIAIAGEDTLYCESLLAELERRSHHTKDDFIYRYSYGYAKRSEIGAEETTHDQYMLADQRMYVMKDQHHMEAARGTEVAHD